MIGQWRNNVWVRRSVFVLANGAAIAAFWFLFAWPIQAFFAGRDTQISEQRALLARLNAIIAQRATVEGLASRSGSAGSRVEFLQGANDGVAAANLQTLLGGMVQTTGAHLRSIRTLPAKVNDDMKFIGAQVDLTGSIQAVYQTVRTIETAKPFLFIRTALLKPTQQGAVSPSGNSAEPTIDVQLDVVGAMQSEGGK
jgi:hypothetical protein